MTLTWTSPPTDVVNMYTISYRRISGCSAAPSGSTTTTMKTITISGLEENIQYEFTITATNNAGTSLPAMYTVTTASASKLKNTVNFVKIFLCKHILVPSGSPPQPTLTGHSATSFTVSWDKEFCLSRNGPRGYYTVKYFVTESTEILTTTNVILNSRTFTASSLTPATSYTFQVAYTNTIGTGPFVNLIITTMGYDSKFQVNL